MAIKATAALVRRQRQSVIVSVMMLTIVAAVRRAFRRKKNFSGHFEEWLIAMAVRQNDSRGGKPLTVAGIANGLGVPRSNAKRALAHLTVVGMVCKEGNGYVGDPAFLVANLDADYFKIAMEAILTAADQLRAVDTAQCPPGER